VPDRPLDDDALDDDAPLSADLLLRRAAEGDAARAVDLLASVSPTKLLDAVLTQAELAVDEDRHRPAGIDAIAELDRASIEVLGLPQGADLDLDLDLGLDLDSDLDLDLGTDLDPEPGDAEPGTGERSGVDSDGRRDASIDLEFDLHPQAGDEPEDGTATDPGRKPPWLWQERDDSGIPEAADIVWHTDDAGRLDAPVLIGWELTTVDPADLQAAVLTLPIRPWHLALVAFADHRDAVGVAHRQVAAATADGRLVGACLRSTVEDADPDILDAVVTRDAADLGEWSALGASLRAALRSAARGVG